MDKDQIQKIVAEKIDAALKSSTHPKKFFITENGRGVVDGGDLYNAVLNDVLSVVKVALVEIIEETCNAKVPANEPKVAAIKPVAQNESKDAKVSTAKSSSKDKKR